MTTNTDIETDIKNLKTMTRIFRCLSVGYLLAVGFLLALHFVPRLIGG